MIDTDFDKLVLDRYFSDPVALMAYRKLDQVRAGQVLAYGRYLLAAEISPKVVTMYPQDFDAMTPQAREKLDLWAKDVLGKIA